MNALTVTLVVAPFIVLFGFWLQSQRKQTIIKSVAPGGRVGPEILVERTKLDQLREFAGRVFVYGGIGFMFGMLAGMAL